MTERIRLGTGVLPIFSRTPASCAQTAATIDEISGGRMVLGLGVSHRITVENWFDAEITKPVTQMREYAGIVRAVLRGEEAPRGEFFNSKFALMGYPPRPELPIYIAALSPKMLQLAGEIGDGVMLWLCNPDYIRETVIPRSRGVASAPASRWTASMWSRRSGPLSRTIPKPRATPSART